MAVEKLMLILSVVLIGTIYNDSDGENQNVYSQGRVMMSAGLLNLFPDQRPHKVTCSTASALYSQPSMVCYHSNTHQVSNGRHADKTMNGWNRRVCVSVWVPVFVCVYVCLGVCVCLCGCVCMSVGVCVTPPQAWDRSNCLCSMYSYSVTTESGLNVPVHVHTCTCL